MMTNVHWKVNEAIPWTSWHGLPFGSLRAISVPVWFYRDHRGLLANKNCKIIIYPTTFQLVYDANAISTTGASNMAHRLQPFHKVSDWLDDPTLAVQVAVMLTFSVQTVLIQQVWQLPGLMLLLLAPTLNFWPCKLDNLSPWSKSGLTPLLYKITIISTVNG